MPFCPKAMGGFLAASCWTSASSFGKVDLAPAMLSKTKPPIARISTPRLASCSNNALQCLAAPELESWRLNWLIQSSFGMRCPFWVVLAGIIAKK